jgi:hypothetical protein
MKLFGEAKVTKLFTLSMMLTLSVCLLQASPDNKIPPAEVVSKHLDSIGTAEARQRVKSVRVKGTCILTVKQGGTGEVTGDALLVSEGPQNLIKMIFNTPEYPLEAMLFDGKKLTVSQFRPGVRTAVGQFFLNHEILFKEGVAGGTLSASWPLHDLKQKDPKLEYSGLKKVDGVQLHALTYSPRKGSDIKITLFFEAETFRHVRTDYARDITATDITRIQGGGGRLPGAAPGRATDARIRASEEFSDFRPEGGLNLPHTYKFHLAIQSEVRPALVDWVFSLTDFKFNEPVDPKEFVEN